MNLVVRKGLVGFGAFAQAPFRKGEIIVDWSRHPLFEEPPRLLPEYRFVQVAAGVYLGPVGPEKYPDAYLNHSCLPNATVLFERPKIHLFALRDIAIGEEVTLDYALLHEPPWSMKCLCGTTVCRGTILGIPSRGARTAPQPPESPRPTS